MRMQCSCSSRTMKTKRIRTHVSLTVIGDLAGHQIELLQTPALLSDDLHTPADTQQGQRSKFICTRSLIKAGVIPSPESNYITQSLNVTLSSPLIPDLHLKRKLIIELNRLGLKTKKAFRWKKPPC